MDTKKFPPFNFGTTIEILWLALPMILDKVDGGVMKRIIDDFPLFPQFILSRVIMAGQSNIRKDATRLFLYMAERVGTDFFPDKKCVQQIDFYFAELSKLFSTVTTDLYYCTLVLRVIFLLVDIYPYRSGLL